MKKILILGTKMLVRIFIDILVNNDLVGTNVIKNAVFCWYFTIYNWECFGLEMDFVYAIIC